MNNGVCFVVDMNFYPIAVALALRVVEIPVDAQVHVFVDGPGAETADARSVGALRGHPRISVHVNTLSLDAFDVFANSKGFPKVVYGRLVAAKHVDCERLLYLDADILIEKRLDALFSLDMRGHAVAAVHDAGIVVKSNRASHTRAQPIQRDKDYFNAGVMLIDREQWLKRDSSTRLRSSLTITALRRYMNRTSSISLFATIGCHSARAGSGPAAGTAFKASKTAPESGFPSNATCPPLPISPAAIAAYLRDGKAKYYSSNAEEKAAELQDKGYIKSLVDPDYKREMDDQRRDLFLEATRDFRRAGENADHPAARAIAFHQAKEALMNANFLYSGNSDELKDRIKELRVKAAEACDEAAQLVEAPEEKLNWVARGLEELQQHVYESVSYHKKYDPVSDTAGSLYYTAAQAFKALPSDEQSSHFKIVKRNPWEASPTDSSARLAATCLTNAAFYSRFSGNPEVIQALFDEAIAILKSIDAPSLESRANLQKRLLKLVF